MLMATSFHGEALGKMGEPSFSHWLESGWAWNASMGIPARSGSISVLCQVLPITFSHAHPTLFYLLPDCRSGHDTHLPPPQVLGSWQMLPVLAFLLALVWRDDADRRLGLPGSDSLIVPLTDLKS